MAENLEGNFHFRNKNVWPKTKNSFPVQPGSQMAAENFLKLGFICEDTNFLYYDSRVKRKNQETQTEFRESDIQTCPWNPPYSLFPRPNSELLFLKNYHYDDDLPAGEVQLDALEAFRSRQKWEKTYLVPGEESKKKYYTILEAREKEKFQTRNQEIDIIQADYLERFEDELTRRRYYVQQLNEIRLHHLWKLKVQEKQKMQYNLAVKTAHVVHGFEHRRDKLYPLHKRRDIIAEYSDFSSQIYCSSKISGKLPSHISHYSDFSNSKYLNSYEGLLQIEPYLSDIGRGEWGPPKRQSLSERRYLRFLKNIQDDFRYTKLTSMKEATKQKKEIIQERLRPFTPTVPLADITEVKKNIASVILKRLIRGRVAQYMMVQEREANQDLINELQSTHYICKAEEERMIAKIASIKEAIQKEAENHEIDCLGSEFLAHMTGEALLDIIIFLALSQLRHREEYLEIQEMQAKEILGSPSLTPAEGLPQEVQPSPSATDKPLEGEREKVALPDTKVTKEEHEGEGEEEALLPSIKEERLLEDVLPEEAEPITGVLLYLSPEQLDIIETYRKKGVCEKSKTSAKKKDDDQSS